MTTIHAAAAKRPSSRALATVLVSLGSVVLAGCESSGILGQGSDAANPQLTPVATAPTAPQAPRTRVALSPVIGAPDAIGKQLSAQMTQSLDQQRVAVVANATDPYDYMVRGYIVAAPQKGQSKISYIWDVNDPAGKRINRITGEEVVPNSNARDAWAGVTPQVVASIVGKTSTSLVAALPPPTAAPATAAGPGQSPPPSAAGATTGAAGIPVAQQGIAPTRTAAVGGAVASTTGSLASSTVPVLVPRVVGAPGDGAQSLSTALQRELSKNGFQVASANATGTNRVEGRVVLGKPSKVQDEQGARDVQSIQIDWHVKNARGENLGTVSQKNEIKPGELDGQWGKTADAAAAAAAQGILKLLQQNQTAAN